jgi:Protein of unknown function (DUF3435)
MLTHTSRKYSIALQNQIMSYGDEVILQDHYQGETVQFDVQAAHISLPSDEMLLKTSRLMSLHIDPPYAAPAQC